MISPQQWFRARVKARAGITQPEREAIVDLLNYCSLVDHDITHDEEIAIDDLEFQLDWDHSTDFDYYMNKSVGLVRREFENRNEESFLENIRGRLASTKSREMALGLCEKLMNADGKLSPEESATLAAIKRILNGVTRP